MERTSSFGLPLLGLFLAVGLIVASMTVVGGLVRLKQSPGNIRVKGFAERPITSDRASWSGSFSAYSTDRTLAYTQLQADLEKVYTYLSSKGVARKDVAVSAVNTSEIYERNGRGGITNRIEGFRLQLTISLTSSDVHLVERLSNESTELIQQGVDFRSSAPTYVYSKIEDLKIELLGEATKNARARAEQLADNSQSSVGPLQYASQGVFQITPRFSTDVSDYGAYDTSTIEKAIKAVVTIEYAIHR